MLKKAGLEPPAQAQLPRQGNWEPEGLPTVDSYGALADLRKKAQEFVDSSSEAKEGTEEDLLEELIWLRN